MAIQRLALLPLALFLMLGRAAAQPANDEALGKAAIAGYSANVQSFSYYRCRFRVTKGQAKSVDDALAGRLLNTVSYEARMAVDAEKDAYESFAPKTPIDKKHAIRIPGNNRFKVIPAPLDTSRYLADGAGRELSFSPEMRAVNLWSSEYAVRGITAPTPLDMFFVGHRSSYGPDVMEAHPDFYEAFYDGTKEVDGHPTVQVRFKNKKSGSVRSFAFDVGRGYVPIRMVGFYAYHPDQPDKTRVFVTDLRECSGQRWFPERSLRVTRSDNARDPYDVAELQVLQLDADHRPGADDLAVHIPAGTQVSEAKNSNEPKFFNLKQDELVHPDDLPAMFDMLNQAPQKPLMDTAIPHRRRWVRWAGAAVGALLATGGVLWFLRRRRRVRA